jgi:trimethylamine corrinoid protein
MTLEEVSRRFNEAIYDTDRERALDIALGAVGDGHRPETIVFDVVVPAMEMRTSPTGERPAFNLAQHFLTSQIAAAVTEALLPLFAEPPQTIGRVVIGNPLGDLHTLGKRIVIACLRTQMIDCVDLGAGVPAERFVDEAVAQDAQVIAISSMMVHIARSESGCLRVRQILRERGLEDRIKIIVGGAPFRFDPQLYQRVEADTWAPNGIQAGREITRLIEEVRSS